MWEPPTRLDKLVASPFQWLVFRIYHLILFLRGTPFHAQKSNPIRVVCISDTHDNTVPNVPNGDLLIHAGDLTNSGTVEDIQKQLDWLASLPHRHKVFVAGNHDSYFDPKSRKAVDRKGGRTPHFKDLHYLQDEMVTLEFEGGRRLNVYGAGDIPECGGTDFA
jgi:predicted MPP superfamily phosphohydrolase